MYVFVSLVVSDGAGGGLVSAGVAPLEDLALDVLDVTEVSNPLSRSMVISAGNT